MYTENDAYTIIGNQCGGVLCRVSGKLLSWNKLLQLIAAFGEKYDKDDCGSTLKCPTCNRLKDWDRDAAFYTAMCSN